MYPRSSCFRLPDGSDQQFDRQRADLLGGLPDAGNSGIEVVEKQVVVKGDHRDVIRNPQSRFVNSLNHPQQNEVAQGEDRRRALFFAGEQQLGLQIAILN